MRHRITLLAGVAYLAACAGPAVTDTSADFQARASASQSLGADVNRDLATLRQATASFHDLATASEAGWSAQITPCMTDPDGVFASWNPRVACDNAAAVMSMSH